MTELTWRLRLFALSLLLALGFSYWMTRELRRLAVALEHLRAELDGKAHVEKVSQLLAHELKSPLTAVRGAVELLQDETSDDRRARLLNNIAAETGRLHRIIEGVLNLARVENRGRLDDVEEIDLAGLVRDLLDTRAGRIAARGLAVASALEPLHVQGNRFLLRQAVANLLDNAIDFSPPDGGIDLSLDEEGGQARLSIRDRGPGIPDYARPRLFERFYSTPRPGSGERGTGLGLNLVREAARLHGGGIELANHPEGGARACFSLPALVASQHETPPP